MPKAGGTDMYDSQVKRLYADPERGHRIVDPVQSSNGAQINAAGGPLDTINPHLYKETEFTLNPSAAQDLVNQAAQATQPVPN